MATAHEEVLWMNRWTILRAGLFGTMLVMLIGCTQPAMEAFKAAEKAIEGTHAAEAVD
jgi:hypothetical protein